MSDVTRILKSQDSKLAGWRLRVAWEDDGEIEIAEEIVHAEQVDNPDARHLRRNARSILTRHEAEWLLDQLSEWLDGGHA